MDHFSDEHGAEYRYKNEVLQQLRKQNEWLEQIAQLLQPKKEKTTSKTKKGTVKKNDSNTSKKRASSR